jgi:hypothetical protein
MADSDVFVIKVMKWDGHGKHVSHDVGVSSSLEVAQDVLVQKAIMIAEWKGLLTQDRVLQFNHRYGPPEQLDLAEYDIGSFEGRHNLHLALIDAQLADDDSISIMRGNAGFAVKINPVPIFDHDNVKYAPVIWEAKWAEIKQNKEW